MRILKTIIWTILLTICAVSCRKSGEDVSKTLALRLEKESVSCSADGVFVYVEASGSWTLSLEDSLMQSPSWARLNKTSGSGNANAVLSYDYNGSEGSRKLIVRLACGSDSVTKTLVQQSNNPSPEPPAQVPSWLELPEQTTSLPYYNHDFQYGGKTYRNYSIGWDGPNRLAQWIAYPLNSFYTAKKVSRSDFWNFDPSIPQSQQPNLFSSYRGYYDRGHQLPSADRLVCNEANDQTFYFSNMTPQRDVFNQGVWGIIEGNVRGWAEKSDTLYVVTGCVMKGSSTSTTDAAGNTCPIPTAYYKAVLRYSKSSTIGWGGFIGMGIYLDHSSSATSFSKTMTMSLTELEKKLDYKLFVNLDAKVGADLAVKIKSQDPKTVSFWGL